MKEHASDFSFSWPRSSLHIKVIFFDVLQRGWWDRWKDCLEMPPLLCVEKAETSDSAKCVPTKGKKGFRGLYNGLWCGPFNLSLCDLCKEESDKENIVWKKWEQGIVTSSSSMCKIKDDYCIAIGVKLRLISIWWIICRYVSRRDCVAEKDSVIPCCIYPTIVEGESHSSDSQNELNILFAH